MQKLAIALTKGNDAKTLETFDTKEEALEAVKNIHTNPSRAMDCSLVSAQISMPTET